MTFESRAYATAAIRTVRRRTGTLHAPTSGVQVLDRRNGEVGRSTNSIEGGSFLRPFRKRGGASSGAAGRLRAGDGRAHGVGSIRTSVRLQRYVAARHQHDHDADHVPDGVRDPEFAEPRLR